MILAMLYIIGTSLLVMLGKIVVMAIEAVLIWLTANGLFKVIMGKEDDTEPRDD